MINIISASRRTDIPAFYTAWFMGRIKEGFALYRNPFGGQIHHVSLQPQDVHSIVFWSKDYGPLLPYLPELEAMDYSFCFHFTVTGLPHLFEENVPPSYVAVEQFRRLAGEYGPRRVFWRYDPILFSEATGTQYHLATFESLARKLRGCTERCYISFTQFYAKVKRNADALLLNKGISFYEPPAQLKLHLTAHMAEIAEANRIKLLSCCSDYLVGGKIDRGSCIDGALLHELFPHKPFHFKPNPSRPQCACADSRDIGAYDTCLHGCVYCYANANKALAARNHHQHVPDSEMLALTNRINPTWSQPLLKGGGRLVYNHAAGVNNDALMSEEGHSHAH